ncbi:MAG: MbcA/ParS/Xre antitoxin family protein [Bryobacteraceae bacterium]
MRTVDAAVNGVNVLRGLIVAHSHSSAEMEATQTTRLPPSPEILSRQSVLDRVLGRATEVIGSREKALRWLGTPVRALNYATPVSLLLDDAGADQVLAVLANLENGIL